jgi:hypothetical protein
VASALPQNGAFNPMGTVSALTFQALQTITTRYFKRLGLLT